MGVSVRVFGDLFLPSLDLSLFLRLSGEGEREKARAREVVVSAWYSRKRRTELEFINLLRVSKKMICKHYNLKGNIAYISL